MPIHTLPHTPPCMQLRIAERFKPISTPASGLGTVTSLDYARREQLRYDVLQSQHEVRSQMGLPPMQGAPQASSSSTAAAVEAALLRTTGMRNGASAGFGATDSTAAAEALLASLSLGASFEQGAPLAWSPPAMKQLSLGLSVLGLGVQV